MPLRIVEWFGHALGDHSQAAEEDRQHQRCPFLGSTCTKTFNDGSISGVCSVAQSQKNSPVVICPNRLYSSNYSILADVADVAFGHDHKIIHPDQLKSVIHDGHYVVAFGKGYGKELRLPRHGGRGGYFVDWVLARIAASGELAEFVAVEIQTIDTTGTYRPAVFELRSGNYNIGVSKAGLNWENVNKRILPQLIYKGHVLRGERLCTKGLFFICPEPVYDRAMARLGNNLRQYDNLQPGSITFMWYNLGPETNGPRPLTNVGQFSTTVDQVALGFTAPANLPPAGVYEQAIRAEL